MSEVINTTATSGLAPTVQTYYDKKLIRDMKPRLVHYQYGQKRSIPRGSGKTVNFRKMTPFAAITTALGEGVVPTGQEMAMTELTATVAQYGSFVKITDMLDMTAIDPMKTEAQELMADQGGLSVDHIVRAAMLLGTNDQVAGAHDYRYEAISTNILTTTEIRKAVRTLKNNKARPFMRNGKPYFIAIVSPNSTYDLQSDTLWQGVGQYQDKEAIFSGEIGRLFGVIFVETTEAATIEAANLTAAARNLTVASWTDGTKTLVVDEAITEAEATALAGRKLLISDEGTTGKPQFYATIASATAGAAGSAAIVLTQNQSALGVTPADGDVLYPGEAGAGGIDLEATLVFGQDAYGVVDIENGGNVQLIVKGPGSAGTADPLNQFSTVGWKVKAMCAKILQDGWMVRIEHAVSA
jgi:N4-gp56 family major capsid protein